MKSNAFAGVRDEAFTLVELMVSTAIIVVLLLVLVQITGQTSATWRYTASKTEQFREARNAFDSMTRRISQATLNTYWDYDSYAAPKDFIRRSELRFACGPMQTGATRLDAGNTAPRPTHGIFFQAPFGYVAKVSPGDNISPNYEGLDTVLNTWGYYVEVNDDRTQRPPFIKPSEIPFRVRYRLMEFMQPTGAMSIYQKTSGQPGQNPDDTSPTAPRNYAGFDWFRDAFKAPGTGTTAAYATSHVLAENILALFILPKLSREDAAANLPATRRETALAPRYYYHSAETGPAATESNLTLKGLLNTKHQLPPVIQVTMVALDEISAQRAPLKTLTDDRFGVLGSTFATTATDYSKDLLYDSSKPMTGSASLEKRLIDLRLNYRIFTSNIYLRGAKWSRVQTK